jgi:7,8-dihydropterin-6-yl-methyl-4-(beta-D-ribofuranosyl)aminobenzene 5'-phosphate synthase
MRIVAALAVLVACLGCARSVAVPVPVSPPSRGILLEQLSWVEAERALTPSTVVVLALGAESKEHGPHLKLGNDFLMAEYLKRRVLAESNVVVAPTINFGFYPAFTSYPGSTSLRFETARDLLVDVVDSLARHGPRRFYVINTGVSTLGTLEAAASALAARGILLRYTNLLHANERVEREVRQEEGGTHADEIETSMMLYMAPESVEMSRAVKDYSPRAGPGPLSREPDAGGVYSPTGIWGDPTLATLAKGKRLTEGLVAAILGEIEETRTLPIPAPESPRETGPPPREAVRTAKVTILSTMLADKGIGEWGFSALVEVDGQRILFDTGARPETVLRNAEEMKIDLASVTDVILSHNHDDHTGGLVTLRRELMKKNPSALSRAHVTPPIFWSRPSGGTEKNPMLKTRREYEALGGAFVSHTAFDALAPGVYLTGPVPRVHPEKNYGRHGKVGPLLSPSGVVDDTIPEDQSLVIVTAHGLVVVAGCGHAGMINTLEYALKSTNTKRVYAAIGGFHLFDATDETLAWTAGQLGAMQLAYLIGAHCTGIEAVHRLRTLLSLDRKTAVVAAVGASFDLDKGIDALDLAQ